MAGHFSAVSVGELVNEQLKLGGQNFGEVTNIFETSLYVRTVSDSLLHVTGRSLRSPVSLNIEAPADFRTRVKPHEKAELSEDTVRIGEMRIGLAGVKVYKGELPAFARNPAVDSVSAYVEKAATILRILEKETSALDVRSPYHQSLVTSIRQAIAELVQRRPQGFIASASTIVGLGSGFTPAGDDLMGGFLLAHNALGPATGLSPILLPLDSVRKRTSWASAQMLNYMQNLVVDEQIRRIMCSVAEGSAHSFLLEIMDLVPRGHTSGLDILTGIVLGLATVREVASGDGLVLRVLSRLGLG